MLCGKSTSWSSETTGHLLFQILRWKICSCQYFTIYCSWPCLHRCHSLNPFMCRLSPFHFFAVSSDSTCRIYPPGILAKRCRTRTKLEALYSATKSLQNNCTAKLQLFSSILEAKQQLNSSCSGMQKCCAAIDQLSAVVLQHSCQLSNEASSCGKASKSAAIDLIGHNFLERQWHELPEKPSHRLWLL